MVVAQLLFKSDSKLNPRLTRFLKQALPRIIAVAGIQFQFIIVPKRDFARLHREHGIKELPVLDIGGKKVVGVPNIIEFLSSRSEPGVDAAPVDPFGPEQLARLQEQEATRGLTKVGDKIQSNDQEDDDEKARPDFGAQVARLREERYGDGKQPTSLRGIAAQKNVRFQAADPVQMHNADRRAADMPNAPIQLATDDIQMAARRSSTGNEQDEKMFSALLNNMDMDAHMS